MGSPRLFALKSLTVLAGLFLSPLITQAGVIVNSGTLFAETDDAVFGFKQAQTGLSNTFPAAEALIQPGLSFSSTNYTATQNPYETEFSWFVVQHHDGSTNGYASQSTEIVFTSLDDAKFAWSADWSGLSTAGTPYYQASLFDKTTSTYLFEDQYVVADYDGSLIAGHEYQLLVKSWIWTGGTAGAAATASGNFQFTVSAVPEPSSALLLACGAAGVGAFVRRRKARQA